jgi:hypothetical protein
MAVSVIDFLLGIFFVALPVLLGVVALVLVLVGFGAGGGGNHPDRGWGP